MLEALAYAFVGACAGIVITHVANFIFDLDGSRADERRRAEECAIAIALCDPQSPQSQQLKHEIEQILKCPHPVRGPHD